MARGGLLIRLIDSEKNPYIQHLSKLESSSAYRREMKKVLLEGRQWIEEIFGRVDSFTVLSTSKELLKGYTNGIVIPPSIAKKLSQVEMKDHFFAEVSMPDPKPLGAFSRILVLDAVSDPGNLGTLLRTALALGWEGVFFLPGCCDPFNGKALRASKGALFRLPYGRGEWSDLKKELSDAAWTFLAADLKGDRPEEVTLPCNTALVFGNEGQGLSLESRQLCRRISIPISSQVESLNVAAAGAILMYLLRKGVR